MMKHEFEELVGMSTTPESYEKIEFVYMNSEKFGTKQEIAEFYKKKDMNGIEKEYKEITETLHRSEEFKDFLFDIAYFSRDLNGHIKQYIASNAHKIYANETTVKLLREYRNRNEEELLESVRYFAECAEHPEYKPLWENHCLTNARSFKDVLEHLIYREWWSEHAKEYA
jgi:hypothetical protein